MEFILIFVLGLCVGSFLNVLVDRLPREESIAKGRSHCEKCKKELAWHDLIPLFSFLILKGRCRYCYAQLSFYYPVVELTTGILFVAVLFFVGAINIITIINFIFYLFLISGLIVIFFVDLKYGIIPDKITYSAILVCFAYIILNTYYIIPFLASALGGFLFFLAIFLATRGRGMGFGDVKFAFLIGLLLGFPNIVVAFYTSFLTGAIISIILILAKKKKFKGSTIPFGPFMVIGTLVALFWGQTIIERVFPFLILR